MVITGGHAHVNRYFKCTMLMLMFLYFIFVHYITYYSANAPLWRRVNARNVRLYYPSRQYTNLFKLTQMECASDGKNTQMLQHPRGLDVKRNLCRVSVKFQGRPWFNDLYCFSLTTLVWWNKRILNQIKLDRNGTSPMQGVSQVKTQKQ